MKDAIVLATPDPGWPMRYAAARDEVLRLLPVSPLLIEHIGSTAIPGLAAKPIIDIIVLVADMAPIRVVLSDLEAAGYEFRPDVSVSTRLFLRRFGTDGARTHHLHVHTDAAEVQRHLIFRDRLREVEGLRRDYEALKRDLASRHNGNREAYSKGKDAFIDAVVLDAGGPARKPFWPD